MLSKNNNGNYNDRFKMETSLEEINSTPNKLQLLVNKYNPNAELIKTNEYSNLNLDYVPQELFMNFKNKKINENEIINDVEQINNESKMHKIFTNNFKNDIINSASNIINNNELSINESQNIKNKNILESNHFNSLYFNDKSNELKSSKKII